MAVHRSILVVLSFRRSFSRSVDLTFRTQVDTLLHVPSMPTRLCPLHTLGDRVYELNGIYLCTSLQMKATRSFTLQHVVHGRHGDAGPSAANLRHEHHHLQDGHNSEVMKIVLT